LIFSRIRAFLESNLQHSALKLVAHGFQLLIKPAVIALEQLLHLEHADRSIVQCVVFFFDLGRQPKDQSLLGH
jgi:hypothetical protein